MLEPSQHTTPLQAIISQAKDNQFPADFNCLVSLFQHIKVTTGGHEVAIMDILNGIQAGHWFQQVTEVRNQPDKAARTEAKKRVPYFTPSGTFTIRKADGLKAHSGILAIDIDHDTSKRAELQANPYTFAAHLSISGDGLVVYVKIDPKHHMESFLFLEKYYRDQYGVEIDKSCKNVDRARFVSYDPDLFINQGSQPLAAVELATLASAQPAARAEQPQAPPTVGGRYKSINKVIDRAVNLILKSSDGEKHKNLNTAGFLLGGYVATGFIAQHEAEQALQGAIRQKANVASMEDADKVISRSIREGTAKPILPEEVEMYVREQRREQWPAEMLLPKVATMHGIAQEVLRPAIEQIYQEKEIKLQTFWNVKHSEDKGKTKTSVWISESKFLHFLEDNGFGKYVAQGGVQIVKVDGSCLEVVELHVLQGFVRSYIEGLPFEFDGIFRSLLLDTWLSKSTRLCKIDFLGGLEIIEPNFVKDTNDSAYFFYGNAFVVVTRTGIEVKEYDQLPGLIWKQQKINRTFAITTPEHMAESCEFYRFCFNVTGHSWERVKVLLVSLGYLLHQYRSRTNYSAIILCDQGGRTGKGIIGQALSHMAIITRIDGRNVDMNRPFVLQGVNQTTDIVLIDDADPNRFPLERIFTWLTEGLIIECKNKPSYEIPFESAPKFLITSNSVFDGPTASHEGRKVEIEFEPYYSLDRTPAAEFGHELFSGWDQEQWQLFDNFMLWCCQLYLESGLKRYKSNSLQRKKAIQATCEEFVAWAEENLTGLVIGSEINKKTAYQEVLQLTGHTEKTLAQPKVTRWLKDYLTRLGFVFKDTQRRYSGLVDELLVIHSMPPAADPVS